MVSFIGVIAIKDSHTDSERQHNAQAVNMGIFRKTAYFGRVENGNVRQSEIGKIAHECFISIPEKSSFASVDTFMTEWKSLYDSKSGERGIFSRYAAKNVIERANNFRKQHFPNIFADPRGGSPAPELRDSDFEFGCRHTKEPREREK